METAAGERGDGGGARHGIPDPRRPGGAPAIGAGPPDPGTLSLFALAGELAELAEALLAAEADGDAARDVEDRLAALDPYLRAKAGNVAALVRHLEAMAEAGCAEVRRLESLVRRRKGAAKRVRRYVAEAMGRMGVRLLEGPTYRIGLRQAGGRAAVRRAERLVGRINLALAKPVPVDVGLLRSRVNDYLALRGTPFGSPIPEADWLALAGCGGSDFEPDAAKVHAWMDAHGGEVPFGVEVLARREYVSIE